MLHITSGLRAGVAEALHIAFVLRAGLAEVLHIAFGLRAGFAEALHIARGLGAGFAEVLHIAFGLRAGGDPWCQLGKSRFAQTRRAARARNNGKGQRRGTRIWQR